MRGKSNEDRQRKVKSDIHEHKPSLDVRPVSKDNS